MTLLQGALMAVAGLGITLLVHVLSVLMTEEARGRFKQRGRRIVETAVERLPACDRERWREEWLAEYEALADRPLTAFAWALRVRSRSRALAKALGQPSPISRIEQRRRRLEARRQLRLVRVREHLAEGNPEKAIVAALREKGMARLALLGLIARESDISRTALAHLIANARPAGRLPLAAAEELGRSVGSAVAYTSRVVTSLSALVAATGSSLGGALSAIVRLVALVRGSASSPWSGMRSFVASLMLSLIAALVYGLATELGL